MPECNRQILVDISQYISPLIYYFLLHETLTFARSIVDFDFLLFKFFMCTSRRFDAVGWAAGRASGL